MDATCEEASPCSTLLTKKNSHHFVQRYFNVGYILDIGGIDRNDLCILVHSNRVCVVTLAKSHYLLHNRLEISKVDFQINANTNRMENTVRGKRKHGGQFLGSATDPLCRVTCSDGSSHVIPSGIRGKLIEVNRRLPGMKSLLTDQTLTEGYLAIVMPKLSEYASIVEKILPFDQYVARRPEVGTDSF